MKVLFSILLLVAFGCETKTKKSISENSVIEKLVQNKIVTENKKYFVGDYNNDKVFDTAFVNYKWNSDTNEIACEKNNCKINIEFQKNIPKISFDNSLGIVVAKTIDLNNDKANEIIVFSRTNQGWWNNISVWSFKNGNWNEIGQTSAFISEDKDFDNRISKEKGKYYLIGEDKWKEDENGDFKKIKVKL